jgi:hypothetical protein
MIPVFYDLTSGTFAAMSSSQFSLMVSYENPISFYVDAASCFVAGFVEAGSFVASAAVGNSYS